jgi:glucose-6-phosphate 1-dehydrogenase
MSVDQQRADALVIFGASGDLAKLETFPALVGLVDRGILDVPVIASPRADGDWTSSATTPPRRCATTASTLIRRPR